MAHDIEDVWDKLQDIKTTLNALNDLHPIKTKCDEIIATQALKQDIKITCTRCKGTGKVLTNSPAGPGAIVEIDCPECVGVGWNIIGSINEVEV